MTDTETTEDLHLDTFDPTTLLMDENVRSDAAGTVDGPFIASLKASKGTLAPGAGNQVPILIKRTGDGRLRVFDGARRTIGCQRAKLQVAGIIVGEEGDNQSDRRARIIGQLFADERQKLTTADRAQAMLTLFEAENMTPGGIAKATGRGKGEVEASLAVARSEVASKATAKWEFLTLEQAAVLAEFDGDTQALTALAKAAKNDPGQFDHVAQQYRDSAAERAQKAELTAELEAAGYQILDAPVGWAKILGNLRDDDGNEITAEQHAACPGRAVRLSQEYGWLPGAEAKFREVYDLDDDDEFKFSSDEVAADAGYVLRWQVTQQVCTDPEGNGHRNMYGQAGGGQTSGQAHAAQTAEQEAEAAEKASAERRRVLAGNKAWRAARKVRHEWLRSFCARRGLPKQPKGLPRVAARAFAGGSADLRHSMDSRHQLAAEIFAAGDRGLDDLIDAAPTDGKAAVIELGLVLCAWEEHLDDFTWRKDRTTHYYNPAADTAARYLLLAELLGHTLSEIERTVAYPPPAGSAPGSGASSGQVAEPPPDGSGAGSEPPSHADPNVAVAPPVAELDTGAGAVLPGNLTPFPGISAEVVGTPFPDRDGYLTGRCGHAVAVSEWRAGFRTCESCPDDPPLNTAEGPAHDFSDGGVCIGCGQDFDDLSGPVCHGPEVEDPPDSVFDPGDAADDQGGMSEVQPMGDEVARAEAEYDSAAAARADASE